MLFIPDAQLDQWLLEDIYGGDLTTRSLGIHSTPAEMHFVHRGGGTVSAIHTACRLLRRLDIEVSVKVQEGQQVAPDTVLLSAYGPVERLHQGWKVTQNLLEWSCGVTDYLARMCQILQRYNPDGVIACTRKIVPGTHLISMQAVLAGGGIMHRIGTAESLLVFAQHRHFMDSEERWSDYVQQLRKSAPEKSIIIEVECAYRARQAMRAQPDVLQLDKVPAYDIPDLLAEAREVAPNCRLSAAGGITLYSIEEYAKTGIGLLITSAPYHAPPADIGVRLQPS